VLLPAKQIWMPSVGLGWASVEYEYRLAPEYKYDDTGEPYRLKKRRIQRVLSRTLLTRGG